MPLIRRVSWITFFYQLTCITSFQYLSITCNAFMIVTQYVTEYKFTSSAWKCYYSLSREIFSFGEFFKHFFKNCGPYCIRGPNLTWGRQNWIYQICPLPHPPFKKERKNVNLIRMKGGPGRWMNEWMNEFIILSYKTILFINDNNELNFAFQYCTVRKSI